jgi:hypothetical protein
MPHLVLASKIIRMHTTRNIFDHREASCNQMGISRSAERSLDLCLYLFTCQEFAREILASRKVLLFFSSAPFAYPCLVVPVLNLRFLVK